MSRPPRRSPSVPRSDAAQRPAAVSRRLLPWRSLLVGGLAALWVARPLLASESVAQGDGLLVAMLWLLALLLAAAAGLAMRQVWPLLRIDGWVVAVQGAIALAALVAMTTAPALGPRNMLWEALGMAAAYLTTRIVVLSPREWRALLAAMMAMAVAIAAYGLYQYAIEMPATRAWFEQLKDPAAELRKAGMEIEPGSPAWESYRRRLHSVEPFGPFALANSLAGYLVPWLVVLCCLATHLWLDGRTDRRARMRLVAVTLGAAVILLATLFLTKSRTAFVALAGVGCLWLLPTGRWFNVPRLPWRWLAVAAATVIVLAAGAAFARGLDRFVITEAGKSLAYRFQYWHGAMQIVLEKPLFGCGPGRFSDHYTRFKAETASEEVQDPHQFLLEIAATAGLPAALLLLVSIGSVLWRGIASARTLATSNAIRKIEPAAATSEPPRAEATRAIYIGSLIAIVLAWFVRQSVDLPLELLHVAGAGLIVGGVLWLLVPWIESGELSPGWLALATIGLWINLTAAGGVLFPGVIGVYWLFAAAIVGGCGMARARTAHAPAESNGATKPPAASTADRIEHRATFARGPWLALAAASALLVGTGYYTAYLPSAEARLAMGVARDAVKVPHLAMQYLGAAGRADLCDPEPLRRMADLALADWRTSKNPEAWQVFVSCSDEYLVRRGPSADAYQQIGVWYETAYRTSQSSPHGEKAAHSYGQVLTWYPHSAARWAQRARILDLIQQPQKARDAAREALRLDRVTPHTDRKLSTEQRAEMERIGGGG